MTCASPEAFSRSSNHEQETPVSQELEVGAEASEGRARRAIGPRRAGVATSPRKTVSERVAAMARRRPCRLDDDESLQSLLTVLRDRDEPIKVRLAALAALQAASFSVVAFESCRSDYIATLRAIADDPDPELRQRVLGILAREKDGFAQKKLLEGLEDPEKALVPPEKALQLLGYDVHAEAYGSRARSSANPPNPWRNAKRCGCSPRTRLPSRFSRRSCATRTRRRNPADLGVRAARDGARHAAEARARDPARHVRVRRDAGDEPDRPHAVRRRRRQRQDDALMKRVSRMRRASSTKVKQSAKRFLMKYGE